MRRFEATALDPVAHLIAFAWAYSRYLDRVLDASGAALDRIFGSLGL